MFELQPKLEIKQEKADTYIYDDEENLEYIEVEEIIMEEDDEESSEVSSWDVRRETPDSWPEVAVKQEPQQSEHNTVPPEEPAQLFVMEELVIKAEVDDVTIPAFYQECLYQNCNKSDESDLKTHIQTYSQYKCKLCGKEYNDLCRFNLHLKLHVPLQVYECDWCDFKSCKPLATQNHQNSHYDVSTGCCFLCGGYFKNKKLLRGHMKLHNSKKFPCHLCEYSGRYSALIRHINYEHKGAKTVKCTDCEEKFISHRHMMGHRKQLHGPKFLGHQCPLCLTFYASTSLRDEHFMTCLANSIVQEKINIKKKTAFNCNLCGFSGKTGDALKLHLAYRHNPKKETFKCEKCPFVGKCETGLALHTSTQHKEEVKTERPSNGCHLCDSVAENSTFLTFHIMQKHGGLKTIKCRTCQELFFTVQSMLWHTKRYHVPTRHKCKKCSKYYKTRNTLITHKKKFCSGGENSKRSK